MLLPESRQLLRAHAGLTARTFQNIIDHIDFGDFVSVCQPDAADFALPQQVIGRMTADAQHGLQIATSGDMMAAIWECVGYTVLLVFVLFKTGSLSKSIFGAH